tara:strand:- start:243 stop:1349 length:1107 start_codon:yes stop_codon:yes gene_type:complete
MFNKINIYIFYRFFYSFLITFTILAIIIFVGDFVEQFRKSAGKNVPIRIIFQLAALNFPSLITFTLPITAFLGSIMAHLILIRNSESIIISAVGFSSLKAAIPAILLYVFISLVFITIANPLIAVFDKHYSELEYKYIDRVDKFASITKNGLWLKQENDEKNLSSVLYAQKIQNKGKDLYNFMVLEYDDKGAFQGRLDGEFAELINGYWAMSNIQISPKYGETSFEENILYKTNIKLEDITDSLSSPSSISIYRLLTFISFLESLGYSAIDFKMHLYDLIFLPLFIASMVLLASAIVMNLKQNDKFTKIIIYSFIIIFIIYFLSNLLDALGSTSQIHPLTSKLIMPLIVLFISIMSFQFHELKRKKVI